MTSDLLAIKQFLYCETPEAWRMMALKQMDILLIDHANCEKKAAATAMHLLHRYVEYAELLHKMSRLAREELLHFEKVLALMQERHIVYRHLPASRYAAGLRAHIRSIEPDRLIDLLIIGAIIEARSCERFAQLVPLLTGNLKKFYQSLLQSEARHFIDYLNLANLYAKSSIQDRLDFFLKQEKDLIVSADSQFRFHSGVPESLHMKTAVSI